jgi:hypothetical protein
MDSISRRAFLDELEKIAAAAKKIKSNDRMPARTKANIAQIMVAVHGLPEEHRDEALRFSEKVTPEGLFELLHGMRRWYTGQTMGRSLLAQRESLLPVMKLEPKDMVGIYRGFKVDRDDELAKVQVGQQLTLPVTRNHGFSSWSTTQEPTNKFSGGGNGKVGLIVKLVDHKGIVPVLAPPEHTADWFNALYESAIGKSFRPKEGEYLISSPSVRVEVVRVKK